MSTETISPTKAASIRTLDPQAAASKSTLKLPEPRPRHDSIASNKSSSVKSVYSRPESRTGTIPDSGDEYDGEGAPQAPPIPGFVVAGSKRNADFHELFPNVPEMDYLIQDYGCAWHREILIQGRLYISENHLCFYANIFGWITTLTIPFLDVLGLDKRMTAYVIPNAILVTTHGTEYTFASFLARDTVYDVMQSLWHPVPKPAAQLEDENNGDGDDETGGVLGEDAAGQDGETTGHEPTECACGKGGEHYPTLVIDAKFPGTPEKIYELMFNSQFFKDFLSVDQKLTEITISEWQPKEPDSPLLARDLSYIKPLSGGLGPKQTKCEIREETAHLDFDDYVSTLTTTRNPDVPSGSLFSVKSRACLMWAGAASTRLVVTSTMEWTGRSFIRGVIDRSAIDGQKQYHLELEKAMRKYISKHKSDFVPKGLTVTTSTASDLGDVSGGSDMGERTPSEIAHPMSASSPSPSMLSNVFQILQDLSQGAFDSARGISTTNALGVLVVVLALSNLWSLLGPRAEPRLPGEMSLKARSGGVEGATRPSFESPRKKANRQKEVAATHKEIKQLRQSMETIEKRLAKIEASLTELD
ncbi:GRAM-domain-containing protein [Ceratobasidium sp. AG-I]|nr:GRAM-domain-containing protein [Ceratobasidium sp. AG-I]